MVLLARPLPALPLLALLPLRLSVPPAIPLQTPSSVALHPQPLPLFLTITRLQLLLALLLALLPVSSRAALPLVVVLACSARWLQPLRMFRYLLIPPALSLQFKKKKKEKCEKKKKKIKTIANSTISLPSRGVAVGSSIGHAVGNWFTGGSSSSAPLDSASPQANLPADAQPMDSGLYQSSNTNSWANEQGVSPCENDIKSFRKCMDEHEGNMSICGWYLDQLVRFT